MWIALGLGAGVIIGAVAAFILMYVALQQVGPRF